jgi:hypothetical protein
VSDTYGGIGNIDVLPSRSRGPVSVDPEILLVYLDIDFFIELRIDEHRRKTGLALPHCTER